MALKLTHVSEMLTREPIVKYMKSGEVDKLQ